MADVLKHKGYIGSIEFDLEDGYLHGRVQFINDCIIYDGETIPELQQSFREAVDGYLEMCAELGKTPDATCSGTFNVRIAPDLHKKCQQYAFEQGISLNATVERALQKLCNNQQDPIKLINKLMVLMEHNLQYQTDFSQTIHLERSQTVQMIQYS